MLIINKPCGRPLVLFQKFSLVDLPAIENKLVEWLRVPHLCPPVKIHTKRGTNRYSHTVTHKHTHTHTRTHFLSYFSIRCASVSSSPVISPPALALLAHSFSLARACTNTSKSI